MVGVRGGLLWDRHNPGAGEEWYAEPDGQSWAVLDMDFGSLPMKPSD